MMKISLAELVDQFFFPILQYTLLRLSNIVGDINFEP